jgi:hypothetical protein
MLTKKQLDLLSFIHQRVQRDGVPPSFDEMKLALDKHINPNADDSDSSAGTGKDFSSRLFFFAENFFSPSMCF